MILRCEGVGFSYDGGAPVLSGVSFGADRGVTAILGANGAGKSTLLRVLAGVAEADTGRVMVGGKEVRSMRASERARRIAYIAQRPEVSASLSVRQVVSLGRVVIGRDATAVDRAIGRVGLGDHTGRAFFELSVGQRQRVMLARALAQLDGGDDAGRVLIADEPISALDPRFAAESAAILKAAGRELAVVIVVHDPTLALRVADRAVLMSRDGRVMGEGDAGDVITAARLEEVFGVGFDRGELDAGGGAVLMPRMTR